MVPFTVIALGVVSLLTDLSSEMIYPLLPVFLTRVLGAGAISVGLIEAVAETTASILKILSGYLTDRTGRRKPIILLGYGLSSIMRPLIGFTTAWHQVLALRFADRVGKGLRTSPRDALIVDVAESAIRGRAFGIHRAMDHAGAVLGPVVALALLKGLGVDIRTVFLLAAIPAALVIVTLVFFVKERSVSPSVHRILVPSGGKGKVFGRDYVLFLVGLSVFTLGNSSDAFLILRLQKEGIGPSGVTLLWAVLHVVKMITNYIGGRLTDRFGRKATLITGWLYYGFIYLFFALITGRTKVMALFLAYGVYYGLTEPAERAWVSGLVSREHRGRGYGIYHGTVGIMSLPASIVFGLLWEKCGYEYAFLTGGLLALIGSLIMMFVRDIGGFKGKLS